MNELNILIIEDEIIIYMHITKTLKSLGFKNIYTARSSQEAFAIASDKKIDLLFSDIEIEGDMDGIDTTSHLEALYSMPAIFITAYKDKEILSRVAKLDIMGYLLKPYREDELEALLHISICKYNLISKNDLVAIGENYNFCKKRKKVYDKEKEINLTKKELLFFSILSKNINKFVSYELIESIVWYDETVTNSTRRTFYSRTREKFKLLDIKTQRASGIGIFLK